MRAILMILESQLEICLVANQFSFWFWRWLDINFL